ncbi:hypothetical protein LPJ59_000373 [Coemansia sp. RSA 2399]|nr:hypothetical protein LPJ59_000373 [Coemansia sp. RSA 2399]KAJ1908087.1 hypothetical protein LPJ81_000326 [Coemansia sp. IMI 209127]
MVSADQCIGGLLLLVLGIYFLALYGTVMRGGGLHTASVFLAAFSLAYLVSLAAYMPGAANHSRRSVYVVLSCVLGIQAALLAHCAVKRDWPGRAIHGAAAGLALALFVFGMSADGLVQANNGARAAYAVIWCIALAWTTLCSQWMMDAVCAVILGAYLLPLGVDCFAHTAYIAHVGVFFLGNNRAILGVVGYSPTKAAFGLQAAAVILAMAGGAARYWWMRRRLKQTIQGDDDENHCVAMR